MCQKDHALTLVLFFYTKHNKHCNRERTCIRHTFKTDRENKSGFLLVMGCYKRINVPGH